MPQHASVISGGSVTRPHFRQKNERLVIVAVDSNAVIGKQGRIALPQNGVAVAGQSPDSNLRLHTSAGEPNEHLDCVRKNPLPSLRAMKLGPKGIERHTEGHRRAIGIRKSDDVSLMVRHGASSHWAAARNFEEILARLQLYSVSALLMC